MELVFDDKALDRLEVDASFSHGLAHPVVVRYRGCMQLLRAAQDERDLKAMTCLQYKPIPSRSRRQHSIHIDDKHSLVVEVDHLSSGKPLRIVELRVDEQ